MVPPVTITGAPLPYDGRHHCATWNLEQRYDQDVAREGWICVG